MIGKALLAATVASGLIVPVKAGVYLPPKPAIVKASNLEFSKHMLLGMPFTMGMLPSKAVAATGWAFVGVGEASATATSLNPTLNLAEPSGVQEGDLLVACFSCRGTAAFTAPGDWTLVVDGTDGNTNTSPPVLSSGAMFYCIRGSSAPGLSFTRPSSSNVMLGRIVAYRGVDQASPLVTQNYGTTTNTSAVYAGITTSNARDLVVAIACPSGDYRVENIDATDPGTGSGTASNETGDPLEGDWQERCDSGTTLGADCSLAIFDAIKATAGATGNITLTTGSSSKSTMLIKAVFKEAP